MEIKKVALYFNFQKYCSQIILFDKTKKKKKCLNSTQIKIHKYNSAFNKVLSLVPFLFT